MSEELKPCPFCGEYPDKSCVIGEYNESGLYIRLQCPNADKECLACGPWVLYLGDSTDEEDMFKQASEAWNTRHDPGELPEWLKEAIENEILGNIVIGSKYNGTRYAVHDSKIKALQWVLSLLKPEENK